MLTVQFRDLEIFCEVATLRSFSKAAKAHNISQPAVSETVKALEDRLGVSLIIRKRPLELTPAGAIYFEGCRGILDEFRQLEARVLAHGGQVVGPVRVSSIYSVGLLQMDSYVKQFEHLYPDAALELRYLHPDQVLKRVLDDDADVGLISFPPRRPDVVCIPWQEQPVVVVVSPSHRLAARASIRASELDGETIVAFTPELQMRTEIDRWLKQAGVSVDIAHEFDNIENIKRAVEIGSGIALLPLPTVRRELEIKSLIAIPVEDVQWTRQLTIIHKRQKTLTMAVQKFLELLQAPPESLVTRSARTPNARLAGGA